MAEIAIGPIFVREGWLKKKGDRVTGHTHNFDHVTYCLLGKLKVETVIAGQIYSTVLIPGPNGQALIKAELCHALEALEDNTYYQCVYTHKQPGPDGNPITVQEYTGWPESYS